MTAAHLPSNPDDYPPGYLAEYKGGQLVATSIVFIILETFFVVLRFYARRIKRASVGLDDWFIWPALVANVAVCVEAISLTRVAGVGSHLAAVQIYSPEKIVPWGKGILASVWLWALAVALPKLSILGFYLRFFTRRWERVITYLTMLAVAATFVATGITSTLQCSPVAFQWNKSIPGGKCIDVLAFYRWMSFPNIVTDVIGLVLPLPMIWGLRTARHQKFAITVMFATGSVGLISSAFRFVIFFSHDAFKDNTWTSVELLKWTDIEPGIYFIAACMPSLRPLLQVVWKRILSLLVSKHSEDQTDQNIPGPVVHMPTLSFGRDGKRSGFERIVTGDGVDENPEHVVESTVVEQIPDNGIAVRKDIWVENSAR